MQIVITLHTLQNCARNGNIDYFRLPNNFIFEKDFTFTGKILYEKYYNDDIHDRTDLFFEIEIELPKTQSLWETLTEDRQFETFKYWVDEEDLLYSYERTYKSTIVECNTDNNYSLFP